MFLKMKKEILHEKKVARTMWGAFKRATTELLV